MRTRTMPVWLFLAGTWLALLCGWVLAQPATAAEPGSMLGRQLGVNPYTVGDNTFFFADRIKHLRTVASATAPSQGGTGPALDANDMPTGDWGGIIAIGEPAQIAGRYTVYALGLVKNFNTNITPSRIVSQDYNVRTNVTTIVFDVLAVGNSSKTVYVAFGGTQRTPTAKLNSGLLNIMIMGPVAAGSTTSHSPKELFDRRFLAAMAPFSMFRTMDLSVINTYPDADFNWSDRKLPGRLSQASGAYPGPGLAYEYQILLANALNGGQGINVWFSLPDTATDDFIRQFALLVKYGSDGVQPYTGPPGSTGTNPQPATGPRYPSLKGKPAFEYSNELWNPTWVQTQRNQNRGVALHGKDPGKINFDKQAQPNPHYLGFRYSALQAYNMRVRLAEIFGEDRFNIDFFTVLSNQIGLSGYIQDQVAILKNVSGRPIDQLFSKVGGEFYASWNLNDPKATVDQVYAGGTAWWPWASSEQAYVRGLGVGGAGYEGNLNIGDGVGNIPQTPLTDGVERDPRMKEVFTQMLLQRFSEGVDWPMVYALDNGVYAVAPGLDLSSPKWLACQQVAGYLAAGSLPAPAPPSVPILAPDATVPVVANNDFERPSFGTAIGKDYKIAPAGNAWTFVDAAGISGPKSEFSGNNDNTPSGNQFAFIQNTSSLSQAVPRWTAGSYKISFLACQRAATTFPHQILEVKVDNAVVATLQPPTVAWSLLTTPAFAVAAGSHTITLRGTNAVGDYTAFVDNLVIERSAGAPGPARSRPEP